MRGKRWEIEFVSSRQSLDEAKDLAKLLRARHYPAPCEVRVARRYVRAYCACLPIFVVVARRPEEV